MILARRAVHHAKKEKKVQASVRHKKLTAMILGSRVSSGCTFLDLLGVLRAASTSPHQTNEDAVWHSAAEVNWALSYAELRKSHSPSPSSCVSEFWNVFFKLLFGVEPGAIRCMFVAEGGR